MIDPEDYIDQDELDPNEPFYTEASPCESCGQPVDHRTEAHWEPGLMVGPCCVFYINDPPEVPVCKSLYDQVCQATSIKEIVRIMQAHIPTCEECLDYQPSVPQLEVERKSVGSEGQKQGEKRRAA